MPNYFYYFTDKQFGRNNGKHSTLALMDEITTVSTALHKQASASKPVIASGLSGKDAAAKPSWMSSWRPLAITGLLTDAGRIKKT